jgi:hypothetical protein
MTKRVDIGTIEHGLREAFGHVGVDGAAAAIERTTGHRKSASLLRKYGDPDSPRHHLPLRDAMAIDQACVEAGHKPPILMMYQNYLETAHSGGEQNHNGASVCCLALATVSAAGMVSEAVLQSEMCNDCHCNKYRHKEEIYASLLELEEAVSALRRAVMALEDQENVK